MSNPRRSLSYTVVSCVCLSRGSDSEIRIFAPAQTPLAHALSFSSSAAARVRGTSHARSAPTRVLISKMQMSPIGVTEKI